ncbi:Crp/Fnr family transcriptional regulator [Aquibium carbonis]|uniref:Crp/Fnr family transcriptional regulator n=1 Tax=Aquibium carbonis TaxID=2495581 RepID=A0A429Z1E6_9HYPH|nr:Crp/Fnr family transcriptional regulator [Aquibium carbonis]RST87454.1 Crp/Fnr family transcriptional regulator [Aquibium carbonis]
MDSEIPAPLLAVLERREMLTQPVRAALGSLPWRLQVVGDGREIIPEGFRPTEVCLLLDGMAADMRYLASGDRQITTLHVPGDFVDLHGLFVKVLDHGVLALTDCQIAVVRHEDVRRAMLDDPAIADLVSTMIARGAAIQRTWIVCMGRKDPVRRIGHLVCEMSARVLAPRHGQGHRFEFPITQAELADLAGLSVVHTNRALQELRATGLVAWQGANVVIHNWTSLATFAGFDPTYLGLVQDAG